LSAGVDAVMEVPGRRFGLLHMTPWQLWRLRAVRFDHVAIPQMTDVAEDHVNLYRLVVWLAPELVTILPGDGAPRVVPWRRLAADLPWLSCRRLLDHIDVPFLMALLVVARWMPRRQERPSHARLRVMHIIPSLGVGGAQRQLAAVVDATPPEQFDIEVVVFTRAEQDFARRWFRRQDVTVTALTRWPRLSGLAFEIAGLCRNRQVDVVHTWLCLANAVGGAGARLAGVPRVISAVRSLSLWKRTWYRQWWLRPVDVLAARIADCVTVNARALVDDYAGWTWSPAQRITVVHNGLDPRTLDIDTTQARANLVAALGFDGTEEIVGTVGRLAPEKGHALLLETIALLRRSRPALRAVIIGDGQMRGELRTRAADLGVTDIVHFLGERDDVIPLVAGLDLFVLPSIIEGFPNALLEAALLGVPACASRVGGCPDVLDDEAVLFDVNNREDAARVVGAALADRGTRMRRAARTRERARTLFTAARTADTWQRLYRAPFLEDSER
jgi:glycosyltransferase involved in cell wall biosynthesis